MAPKDLMYSKTHEWVKFQDGGTALTGFTDFAQKALGDLVFLDMTVGEGDAVTCGETFADIESIKAVFPVYCHVTGTVAEINADVVDFPQKINEDPYGSWIIKITDISGKSGLMDAAAYDKFCAEQEM